MIASNYKFISIHVRYLKPFILKRKNNIALFKQFMIIQLRSRLYFRPPQFWIPWCFLSRAELPLNTISTWIGLVNISNRDLGVDLFKTSRKTHSATDKKRKKAQVTKRK